MEKKVDVQLDGIMHSVAINYEPVKTGWCVFVGCEGDDPHLIAFFLRRKDAERYIEAFRTHPDEDMRLGDPDIAPSVLAADGEGFIVANDFDFRAGVEAVAQVAVLTKWDARQLREEAAV